MKAVCSTVVALAALATTVHANLNYLRQSELCASACGVSLFSVSFDGKPPAAKGGVQANPMACAEPLWIQSLFLCSTIYCPPQHLQRALAAQNVSCVGYIGMSLPPYSAPDLSNVTTISQMQAKSMSYNHPVSLDRDFFQVGYISSDNLNYAQYTNWDFVWGLYGFWILVISIGVANRGLYLIRSFHAPKLDPIEAVSSSNQQHGKTSVTGSSAWFQQHLVIPFLFGSKRWVPAGYSSLPTRLETALIVIYLTMNVVFCFPGYHLYSMDDLLPERKQQLAKYVANRLGSLAVGNIPVIWLFSARNDPLLWVTGWSYATYSQFHRWSARMLLALVIAHGTTNSVLVTYSGQASYYALFEQTFIHWALVAILSFSILVGTSFYFVRNRAYELWLVTHIAFAVVALVAVFYHTKEVNGQYNGFLWFAVAIWVFDRAMRLARIATLNLIPLAHGTKATAVYNPRTDFIRVSLTSHLTPNFVTTPGSFYFMYEPGRLRGYESHPFSLCSWPEGFSDPRRISDETEKSVELKGEQEEGSEAATMQHTFLIKPRSGFTKRLRERAERSGEYEFKVLLEGPYGVDFYLEKYSNVTMVVGGSGITAAVSRVYDLLEDGGRTLVHIVWVVKDAAAVEDVVANELAMAVGHKRLRVEVYVTGNRGEEREVKVLGESRKGRPQLYEVLKEERVKSRGSLGVMVCGPPGLEGECRRAVAKLMGERGPRLGFFDERFGW